MSCSDRMVYVKGGNRAIGRLGLEQLEFRPAGVWGGGTFVLQHGAEQAAWCE